MSKFIVVRVVCQINSFYDEKLSVQEYYQSSHSFKGSSTTYIYSSLQHVCPTNHLKNLSYCSIMIATSTHP